MITNDSLKKLIRSLKKLSKSQNVKIWKRVAEDLSKPTRSRREVNIGDLNKHTKENETIIVPGKVLGDGELDHNVTVSAWRFSQSAKNKLKNTVSIEKLMKDNPKGNKVRIIG